MYFRSGLHKGELSLTVIKSAIKQKLSLIPQLLSIVVGVANDNSLITNLIAIKSIGFHSPDPKSTLVITSVRKSDEF